MITKNKHRNRIDAAALVKALPEPEPLPQWEWWSTPCPDKRPLERRTQVRGIIRALADGGVAVFSRTDNAAYTQAHRIGDLYNVECAVYVDNTVYNLAYRENGQFVSFGTCVQVISECIARGGQQPHFEGLDVMLATY